MRLVDCASTPPFSSEHGWKSPDGWPTSFIEGSALVCGSAQVYDSARVCGSAQVYGSALVCGSARVYDSARVCGSALVCDSARVCGYGDIQKTTDYICVGPIGSRNDFITLHKDRKIGLRINTGCFSGSVSEFMARLTDAPEHDDYKAIVPALLAVMKRRGIESKEPQ